MVYGDIRMTVFGILAMVVGMMLIVLGLMPYVLPLMAAGPVDVQAVFYERLDEAAALNVILLGGIGWAIVFFKEAQRVRNGWHEPKKPRKQRGKPPEKTVPVGNQTLKRVRGTHLRVISNDARSDT